EEGGADGNGPHQQTSRSGDRAADQESCEDALQADADVLHQFAAFQHLPSGRQHQERRRKELRLEECRGDHVPQYDQPDDGGDIDEMIALDPAKRQARRRRHSVSGPDVLCRPDVRYGPPACAFSVSALMRPHISPNPGLLRRRGRGSSTGMIAASRDSGPLVMTPMRSASKTASVISWVMNTIVLPVLCQISTSSLCIRPRA